jgi:DNA-binding NarL/FixJ family response regulator
MSFSGGNPAYEKGSEMCTSKRTIRVALADDHPVTRAGIRATLEQAPDITVVGEAGDGTQAQTLVAQLQPDVLLLDLVMPGLRSFEVEKWVRVNYPNTITLILTAHDRDFYLAEAIRTGVPGFIVKEEKPDRLVDAIRRAAQGDILITQKQLERASSWRENVGERWESLTQRERQVLCLLGQGQDNAAIAEALNVTLKTVEYHITNVLSKLGVASRLEAAVWVHQHCPDELWEGLTETQRNSQDEN